MPEDLQKKMAALRKVIGPRRPITPAELIIETPDLTTVDGQDLHTTPERREEMLRELIPEGW